MSAKIYNLLSIGQRGAGKTVFLAGSFAAMQQKARDESFPAFLLECEDSETQENISNILTYIRKTGQYPPATLRLSNFDFSLQQQYQGKSETLCQFYWWDTPGESCHLYNPAFVSMVSQADGGCFFIDTPQLIGGAETAEARDKLLQQLQALAAVIAHNQLNFPLAIVLTKCDLFATDTASWQALKQHFHSLKLYLDSLALNYQIFYSGVTILQTGGISILQSNYARNPLLWLLSEIRTANPPTLAEVQESEPVKQQHPPRQKWLVYCALLLAVGAIAVLAFRATLNKEPVPGGAGGAGGESFIK
jgi:GTPase SAR1 family protein